MGGGPGSRSFGAGVGTRQAARRRSPVAARALVPRGQEAAPRARPRATGPDRTLDARGAHGAHGDDRLASASGVVSPLAPPLPAGKRRGARQAGGAPRVSRAATHLAARGSHMAGAAAAASGAASPGQGAAGGAEARKLRPWALEAGDAAERGPCWRWRGSPAVPSGRGRGDPGAPAVCSRSPIPSFHVVARARKLSRARRRWVGGCVCHRVQKRRFDVSHHA